MNDCSCKLIISLALLIFNEVICSPRESSSQEEEESLLPNHTAPAGEPRDVEEGDRRGCPETGPGC